MPSAPLRLRCEFVHNPLGITNARPRLSWWVNDGRAAELQSAYEIMAASSPAMLAQGEADLWQSGRVDAVRASQVDYDGAELACSQRVWWKVRTFDSDGIGSDWSEPAFFEMGLFSEEDWQGHWISTPLAGSRSRGVQAAAMRRSFYLGGATVTRASLYVAALGDYKLEINGAPLGPLSSSAVWCDYTQECYFQTYDLTEQLVPGTNAIGLLLADGYYAGFVPGQGRLNYGDRAALRVFIKVDLEDGQQLSVASDHSWLWHPSWILGSEINDGEHVDFNQFLKGWSDAGFDDSAWLPVQVLPEFRGELRSQPFPNLAVTQVLRPLELPNLPQQPGRATLQYAFGSDVVGRLRLDLRCHDADDIRVHYSIDESFAHATTDSFGTRRPLDHPYMQICEPAFALHSFRFVRVEYTNGATEVEDAFALRVAYAQQPALKMRSDHATLNELISVLHNSISGVAMPVPMRGMQQAERLPDAGYAATWVPMFAQQERAHPLVAKWLADMALAHQSPDFNGPYVPPIPSAIPSPIHGDHTRTDTVAQLETFVHLLWAVYRHHDDRPLLQKYYPLVRAATLAYRHQDEQLLRKEVDPQLFGRDYDAGLVATCTFYGTLQIVAQMAAVLGLMADRELVQGLAAALRNEFRRRYLTVDGYLVGETQSGFVAALYNNLLEEPEQQLAAQGLIRKLQENQYHADVVPAVVRGLLPTLSRAGRLDMAYMVLLQTSQPSWFGNIHAGSKLVARQPGVFDIAEVGLLEWLVESMVGITLDDRYGAEDNAYKLVRIQPMPPFGKQFLAGSPIQFVEAELHTIQGVFVVKWQIGPHNFTLDVVIPPSSTATVVMPDGIEHAVSSGRHAFVMDFDAGGDGIPTLLDTNVS